MNAHNITARILLPMLVEFKNSFYKYTEIHYLTTQTPVGAIAYKNKILHLAGLTVINKQIPLAFPTPHNIQEHLPEQCSLVEHLYQIFIRLNKDYLTISQTFFSWEVAEDIQKIRNCIPDGILNVYAGNSIGWETIALMQRTAPPYGKITDLIDYYYGREIIYGCGSN